MNSLKSSIDYIMQNRRRIWQNLNETVLKELWQLLQKLKTFIRGKIQDYSEKVSVGIAILLNCFDKHVFAISNKPQQIIEDDIGDFEVVNYHDVLKDYEVL